MDLYEWSKCSPFAFQNESFCIPKGVIFESKTSPFARRNESFCSSFLLVFITHYFILIVLNFVFLLNPNTIKL